MLHLRRLVTGLSTWRFRFDPRAAHMGFVVYKTSRIFFKQIGFPDSIPGQPIWDLWCTKLHGFSLSTLVFQIRFQDSPYGICSVQNFTDFLLVLWISLAIVILAMVHVYIPSIYNRRYIISTTDRALQPTLLFLFKKPKYGGSNLLRTSEAICQWKRLGISRDVKLH